MKAFDTLKDLLDYCEFCRICQTNHCNLTIRLLPGNVAYVDEYSKSLYNDSLTLYCDMYDYDVSDYFNVNVVINCVENSFKTKKGLGFVGSKLTWRLHIESTCSMPIQKSHMTSSLIMLADGRVEDFSISQEYYHIGNQISRLSIFHDQDDMQITRAKDIMPLHTPIYDLDFTDLNKLAQRLETIITFA